MYKFLRRVFFSGMLWIRYTVELAYKQRLFKTRFERCKLICRRKLFPQVFRILYNKKKARNVLTEFVIRRSYWSSFEDIILGTISPSGYSMKSCLVYHFLIIFRHEFQHSIPLSYYSEHFPVSTHHNKFSRYMCKNVHLTPLTIDIMVS